MSTAEYRLFRQNTDTAWGFRLQGGLDVNAPLTVQRVFNGSPADGNLQRGDELLSINNSDVSAIHLKRAEELVKSASNALLIVVRRTGQPVNSSQPDNDFPIHQQPAAYRQVNSSSQQPKYDSRPTAQPVDHQTPSSFGSAHQQTSSYQRPDSNVWRPSTQPNSNRINQQTTPVGEGYQPVKNQWQAANPAGGYGSQWSGADAPAADAGSWSGAGSNYSQTGRGGPVNAARDDQPFAPFYGKTDTTNVDHGIGSNQASAKPQQHISSPSFVSSPQGSTQGMYGAAEQSQDQADDEEYESKSVRDIKQMFNQMGKPSSFKPKQANAFKPKVTQPVPRHAPADFSTNNTTNWSAAPKTAPLSVNPVSQTTTRSFTSPPQASPSSNYYDDLYYPPPRQEHQPIMMMSTKPFVSKPTPGAGYSYQGIVTTTPAKTVQGKGKSSSGGGGGGKGPAKKKEFDPSQSLVFQALQEENERAKRGDVQPSNEEAPRTRPQQQQQVAAPNSAQRGGGRAAGPPQRSGRLQELLERDQAQLHEQEQQTSSSPNMSAMARREMSPSYPKYDPQRQQGPSPAMQHHQQQSHPSPVNNQRHYQQQQQQQQYPQYQQSPVPSSSYGYQQQQQQPYNQSYYGEYDSYGANSNNNIPVSDF